MRCPHFNLFADRSPSKALSHLIQILAEGKMAVCTRCGKENFAIERKNLILTLLACLAAIFTVALFFVGPLLGLAALLLVWRSRDEFDAD